jgi:hypothetical protein
MPDIEATIDKFSGFITKEQAKYILAGYTEQQPTPSQRKSNTTVKELLDTVSNAKKNDPNYTNSVTVNVKDRIYRIFNPQNINVKGRESKRRIVILGEEGSTIALNLRDNLSEFMDINSFERGDTVTVNNVFLDLATTELKSAQNTIINRVSPSQLGAITNYSTIKEELRKIDIIGRIVEISPIRHVNRLGRPGQIAAASCIVTDYANTIDASFWGSSAIITANLKPNDFIKMEFCDVRSREGRMQIYVNDDSRVVASNIFASRLLPNKK